MDKKAATLTPSLLFEVSWEVCNKIGGIYTVLSTKAKTLQKLDKDKNPPPGSQSAMSPDFQHGQSQ